MGAEPVALDRRHRRRLETIDEALDHAVEIMAEHGVGGLSLGEIARRMGIQPPSLYVYFPSKHAIYDALFKRGWEQLLEAVRAYDDAHPPVEDDLVTILTRFGEHFTRWSVEHPAYAQLLFWRPVPGFEPSSEAFAPATELYDHTRDRLATLQARGLIRRDVDIAVAHRQWTVLVSGVVSQQLANAPDEPFATGRFTTQLPELARMFATYYGNHATTDHKPAKRTPARRGHAGKR